MTASPRRTSGAGAAVAPLVPATGATADVVTTGAAAGGVAALVDAAVLRAGAAGGDDVTPAAAAVRALAAGATAPASPRSSAATFAPSRARNATHCVTWS